MTELHDHIILTGTARRGAHVSLPPFGITEADVRQRAAYHALRGEVFVAEQGMFSGHDRDDFDDDPHTRVLVAVAASGEVIGGVRIHPMTPHLTGGRDLGWWRGSRLVVAAGARLQLGVGAALIRAACAAAETSGALRFDATIQAANEPLFRRLGWTSCESLTLHGAPHVRVDWPIQRIQRLVDTTKSDIGALVGDLVCTAYLGDDGAPVPGSDLIAACDAIVPSMVERDPYWAGWCSVLVNINDLTAMGASPVGLMDAIGARDASFARRIVNGIRNAAQAWDVPVLGGHTQLGVPGALTVTALGRADSPVNGGGAKPGQQLRLTADLAGRWRPGYHGSQWDSTSYRSSEDLQAMTGVVAQMRPTAAKDVSMTGIVGTAGMLAEASACRAVVRVSDIPAPDSAGMGDWLTCFPGFAMVTAETANSDCSSLPSHLATAVCGELTHGTGVGLLWPDGVTTETIRDHVTGLGPVYEGRNL